MLEGILWKIRLHIDGQRKQRGTGERGETRPATTVPALLMDTVSRQLCPAEMWHKADNSGHNLWKCIGR